MMLRTSAPRPCASVRPYQTPRAWGSHRVARAPIMKGRNTSPSDPAGTAEASWSSSRYPTLPSWRVSRTHRRMEPEALSPCSTTYRPSRACSEHMTRGSRASGMPREAADTLVVVPVETMTRPSPAPLPSTSQGRSPAPRATGTPDGIPRARAASGRTPWGAAVELYTGGNAHIPAPVLPPRAAGDVQEHRPRREGVVGGRAAGEPQVQVVARLEVDPRRPEHVGGVAAEPQDLAGRELRVRHEPRHPVHPLPPQGLHHRLQLRARPPVHPDDAPGERLEGPIHRDDPA